VDFITTEVGAYVSSEDARSRRQISSGSKWRFALTKAPGTPEFAIEILHATCLLVAIRKEVIRSTGSEERLLVYCFSKVFEKRNLAPRVASMSRHWSKSGTQGLLKVPNNRDSLNM